MLCVTSSLVTHSLMPLACRRQQQHFQQTACMQGVNQKTRTGGGGGGGLESSMAFATRALKRHVCVCVWGGGGGAKESDCKKLASLCFRTFKFGKCNVCCGYGVYYSPTLSLHARMLYRVFQLFCFVFGWRKSKKNRKSTKNVFYTICFVFCLK